MSTTTVTSASLRELATRVNGGIEITLFWDTRDDSTSICLNHAETDETITFRVPPGRALEAFHQPFAHLVDHLRRDLQPTIDNPQRNRR
jgi:hypothetical protein